MRSPNRGLVVGIDVGGTNTDAVALDSTGAVIASTKQLSTDDVTGGIRQALSEILSQLKGESTRVGRVMLGTTHATNAIVQRRNLGRVGVVRVGAPAATESTPASGWPADLSHAIIAGTATVRGGFLVDGYPIAPLDTDAIRRFIDRVAHEADAFAITGIFSPSFPDQELDIAELIVQHLGRDVPMSLSHEVGDIGLLERENATILNASLFRVAGEVTGALQVVLAENNIDADTYFAQNDGTLMAIEYASRYPIMTIGSGPANSIRGAAFLSGVQNAIVADVGGTTTDLGVIHNGFPRESTLPREIGGVRTNFRMPDVLSVAVGGGTLVTSEGVLDTLSVGHRLTESALVFGGTSSTLTDAAVSAGRVQIGTHSLDSLRPDHRRRLGRALASTTREVESAIERMSLGKSEQPLVIVGGGGFLIPDDVLGVTGIIRPRHGEVANAVGAAISLASGRSESIAPYDDRELALSSATALAISKAIEAGADPSQVTIVDITETPVSYSSQPTVRIAVKAAGPLGWT